MRASRTKTPPTSARTRWAPIAVAIIASLWVSCAVDMDKVYIKDGQEYGVVSGTFRAKWWNFYERAVSYADGGYYDDAVLDLQRALDQREADQRRARTYGLRFKDYFPNRELGVVYYKQGKLDLALEHLETSIKQVDSARTKFYLNEVRRARLEQSGADAGDPSLALDGPDETIYVNTPRWTATGKASDDSFVDTVSVGGQRVFFELAQPEVSFEQSVKLNPGPNRIEIVAADLVGNEATAVRTVVLDQLAPQLAIDGPLEGTVTNQPRIAMEGSAFDDSPMAIEINGQRVKFDKRSGSFSEMVLLKPGENRIGFSAKDKVGNQSEGEILVYFDPDYKPPVKGALYYDPRPNVKTVSAGGAIEVAGLFDRTKQFFNRLTDRDPPEINIKGYIHMENIYVDQYYLQGTVKDANRLKSLTLNGEPMVKKLGTGLFFAKMIDLEEGQNTFVLEAEDQKGNRIKKTLQVVRKTPKVLQMDMRVQTSLLPFVLRGSVREVGEVAFDNFNTALVSQHRFDLVEREKLDSIIKEMEITQNDMFDSDTQVELGGLVAADTIIAGVVLEKPDSMEVYLRMISPEDATIIIVEADVYGEEKTLTNVNYLMRGLAFKLARKYPLIEGKVLRRTDEGIEVSMGRKDGLNPFMSLFIYRDNPEGGLDEPIEIGTVPVEGRIDGRTALISREVIDFINYINPGDRVITR